MAPRPRLGQLFLPERQYKLTGTAAPLILRALFEAGDRHDQHPTGCVARSIASLLCRTFWGPEQLKQALRQGNTPENTAAVVATLRSATGSRLMRNQHG